MNLDKLYKEDYITFLGTADVEEWKKGLGELFAEKGIGKVAEWVIFTGKDLNEYVGKSVVKDSLTCLAGSLEGLNIEKLAIWRITEGCWSGGRWFSDVVDNFKGEDEDDE